MPGQLDDAQESPALGRQPRPKPALPEPGRSASLLVRLAPEHTAMFRFLLEAYGHTAYFTVLERQTALLRLLFSPHCLEQAYRVLTEIGQSLPLCVTEWPTAHQADSSETHRPYAAGSAIPANGDTEDTRSAELRAKRLPATEDFC
ncbi:MAG: DUF4911 domain-containing protein [Desulfovibrio sp.]|nr:DUF4911 domain-containing protein [Desulfovibrio sp.]